MECKSLRISDGWMVIKFKMLCGCVCVCVDEKLGVHKFIQNKKKVTASHNLSDSTANVCVSNVVASSRRRRIVAVAALIGEGGDFYALVSA